MSQDDFKSKDELRSIGDNDNGGYEDKFNSPMYYETPVITNDIIERSDNIYESLG